MGLVDQNSLPILVDLGLQRLLSLFRLSIVSLHRRKLSTYELCLIELVYLLAAPNKKVAIVRVFRCHPIEFNRCKADDAEQKEEHDGDAARVLDH